MFEKTIEFLQRRRARKMMARRGFVSTRRRGENSELARAADRSLVLGCFMLILVWGVCSLLLTLSSSNRLELALPVLGQRAAQTVYAGFDFTYPDPAATEHARHEAIRGEPRYYDIQAGANRTIRDNFEQFFNAVKFRATPNAPGTRAPEQENQPVRMAASLDPTAIQLLDRSLRNPSAFRYIENELNNLLLNGFLGSAEKAAFKSTQKIRVIDASQRERLPRSLTGVPDDAAGAAALADAILKFYPPDQERQRLFSEFSKAIRPLLGSEGNLVYNPTRTEEGYRQATAKISTINIEIKRFQPLLLKNQIVDEAALKRLNIYAQKQQELDQEFNDGRQLLRNMFWSFTLVLLAGFYLYHIHPEIVSSNRRIGIVGSVVLISLVGNYGGIEFFNFIARESASLPRQLMVDMVPLALVAVLIGAFLGFRVAMCAGFFVASITALMLDMSFEFALKGILICSLSALAVRNATNYRSYFMRTVFSVFPLIWLLNANLFGMAGSLQEATRLVVISGTLALTNAFSTAILALLLIFAYELIFNVSTNMSLLVLSDYNHPLLERLKREAPGTFFHSLMVATLAEDAARAIHANYLKAKAGALFHDIGKLSKPQYFTENNRDMANQHTGLTPQMSSIVIRDHVKEGMELARQYKLNRIVRDAIEQHHGNDLVHYFYRKALEQSKKTGEEVSESQFRYQGMPPQSKEAAIISLADACEAACRSLDKPSAARIEALVDDIFLKRFQDGQLIHADMTLAELEKVRESFINTLLSMKHGRIAYQEEAKESDEDEDDLFVAARKAHQNDN